MNKLFLQLGDLEELESFDNEVFIGNDTVPQEVCNLILSLAIIFNDYRDILHINEIIMLKKPDGVFKISRVHGAYGGIQFHIIRELIRLTRELIDLVSENKRVIESPYSRSIIQILKGKDREAWDAIEDIAFGKLNKTKLGVFILQIRNQVSSHYSPKAISKGYNHYFRSNGLINKRAYISRGSSAYYTRYYFADAAIQGCFEQYLAVFEGDDYIKEAISLIGNLTTPLMAIINGFLVKRGCIFRKERDES